MQILLNTVYKTISVTQQMEYDLIKSVGDVVFNELLHNFKRPKSLILKLRGVGSFFLRKKKLDEYLEKYYDFYHNPDNPNAMEAKFKKPENFEMKLDRYQNLQDRILDYERYLTKKKLVREIRKATQPLIKKQEDDN